MKGFVVLIACAMASGWSSGNAQVGRSFTIESTDVWLRAYGTKYVAPITVSIDSTTLTVNGDPYVINWDSRTSVQKIADGDYGEYEVYIYAGERAMAFRSDPESLKANLTSLEVKIDSLLHAKGLPEVQLVLDGDSQFLKLVADSGRFSLSPLATETIYSPSEIAYRGFDAIRGNLQSKLSVAWGEDYFAGYSEEQAAKVELAIEQLGEGKALNGYDLSVGGEDIEVHGALLKAGMLRDLLAKQASFGDLQRMRR